MKSKSWFTLLFWLLSQSLFSANPVPYSGKIDIGGVNYYGEVQFAFSLHDGNGTTHWRNGNQPGETLKVAIRNGRYNVLLGGQGMTSLAPQLFLNQDKLYLRVEFKFEEGDELQHLAPDQVITATPRALVAEWAKMAKVSERVSPGAITRSMLNEEVLADLNKTGANAEPNPSPSPAASSITRDMLAADVRNDLNRTIRHTDLSPELKADLNRTVTPEDLSPEVHASIDAIIDYSRLSSSVRADLNRTITHTDLSPQIKADLNRTITASNLAPNTITTAQLNEQVLKYLRPEVLQSPEAPGLVFHGQRVILQSRAEGKYLSYQWYRDGEAIPGATQKRYVIPDVNGSLHDGNYTLVVSNDFGTVTTPATELKVDATPPYHTVSSIGLEMIFCPPGTFTMGSPANEPGRVGDETPHTVTLTHGFYLGKYEVTQAQYQTVMNGNSEGLGADPSQYKGSNRPVEKVSWEDAQVFLAQLNAIEQTAGRLPAGWEYALPTEAQWEYACRAGTSTIYSWGNDINSSRANYNWDGGPHDGNDSKQTVEIGQFSANPWGFFDMHGNVWEWVHDWKANYPGGALTDPVGPASGSSRVPRGGSWNYGGAVLRSAWRGSDTPSYRGNHVGFRVGFQAVQPDTADPEVELFGGAGFTREAGQAWAEPGAAGHDVRDGNLTDAITITGTVDVNTTGTYLLTYTVVDAAGNSATATRTVTVADSTAPAITLLGDANITHFKGLTWVDPGATATDTLDGNLSDTITRTGTVDVNTTGVYTLTYLVSDAAGNEANVTRTVNVGLPATYATDLNATVSLDMIWVQPGTFVMGSPTTETGRGTNETEHNVTLTQGFYLGKYEVTQAQYEAVMGFNPSEFNATSNGGRPVEDLNWTEALAFCEQLTIRERNAGRIPSDWAYVLPTESQWEYACRAGTTTVYSWGDDINSSHANYNWDGDWNTGSDFKQTRDVGQYGPNPWGFFDMHGNVWEWTADRFAAAYPTDNPSIDPTGPASGSDRVVRGGSWHDAGAGLRSARRGSSSPGHRGSNIGFRVGFQKSQ